MGAPLAQHQGDNKENVLMDDEWKNDAREDTDSMADDFVDELMGDEEYEEYDDEEEAEEYDMENKANEDHHPNPAEEPVVGSIPIIIGGNISCHTVQECEKGRGGEICYDVEKCTQIG